MSQGSAFEQAASHQMGKAQGEERRAAGLRGDAQQQIGDHRGKDLEANGVFGAAEEGADLEMLFDPAKQQLDLPAPAIERGDLDGRETELTVRP